MRVPAAIVVVGLWPTPLTTRAADMREVPIIVRDTLGNAAKRYRVDVVPANGDRKEYDSPKTVELPAGRLTLRVTASLHRHVTEDVEDSSALEIIMVGLVRPTGSEISGDSSPANPSVHISIGGAASDREPAVLRVLGTYSSYRRDFLIRDRKGDMELEDLPFGEYRAFVFENGRVSREFALINEEFKPPTLKALLR
jgi:hypothetical protein